MRRALVLTFVAACATPAPRPTPLPALRPPVAEPRPHEVPSPFGPRQDPYYWLRDDTRKDPKVLGYLTAENDYAEKLMAPSAALVDELYQEMVGRVTEEDASVPVLEHGYWTYHRWEKGKQYEIHCRRQGSMQAPEEITLDENALAAGHAFYKVGQLSYSPNGKLVAYAEDTVGRNQFTLRVKDLATGKLLPDTAVNIDTDLVWADDTTLFYVQKDPVTLRGSKAMRHRLGTATDAVVHDERDETFGLSIRRTTSERYVVIASQSTMADEIRLVDAARPETPARLVIPRERGHEVTLQHAGDRFVLVTNWQAKNFRVVEVKTEAGLAQRDGWRDLLPHRDDAFISTLTAHRDFLAVSERSGGLRKVRIVPRKGESFLVDAAEPSYLMGLTPLPGDTTGVVRYTYISLTTPPTTYELDVATRKKTQLHREEVRGGHDPARYQTEYRHATAADGTKVPVSIVYRKGTERNGSAPILVRGYGSYGIPTEPMFASPQLSLLDRGWVIAYAHVRGGSELGRAWYEGGKLLQKKNTFTDFIAVTELLVAEKYGAPDKVFAYGGSAGGLLMGAVMNLRPDLYRAIAAAVPFVDVVTTMLDEQIPLTTGEFDEWGNPKQREFYDYMLSYSPYDNVTAKPYPSLYVETGLWDSQVQYFEPAKWVARLRATKTDQNPVVFFTDMTSGHGGKSGRFDALTLMARRYAFFLRVLSTPDAR